LEVSTYGAITRVITSVANNVCGGKLLVKLGGGYDLKVAINSACLITAYLGEYYDYNPPDPYGSPPAEPAWVREQINRLILELKRRLAPYWACFKD
jgi:acetoin utilization deacetylase AcuC-like enzyme